MKAPDDGLPLDWLDRIQRIFTADPDFLTLQAMLILMRAAASRLLFATMQGDALESVVTRNAEGELVHTIVVDQSHMGVWFYAVRNADLRPPHTPTLDKILKQEAKHGRPVDAAFEEIRELKARGMKELSDCLLDPEVEMTDDGRALLTDFVSRHQINARRFNRQWDMEDRQKLARAIARGLKRKQGRQATPIYERSEVDARIECAVAELSALRKLFRGRDDLLGQVAALHGVSPEVLELASWGRLGSTNRKAQRKRKIIKKPRR